MPFGVQNLRRFESIWGAKTLGLQDVAEEGAGLETDLTDKEEAFSRWDLGKAEGDGFSEESAGRSALFARRGLVKVGGQHMVWVGVGAEEDTRFEGGTVPDGLEVRIKGKQKSGVWDWGVKLECRVEGRTDSKTDERRRVRDLGHVSEELVRVAVWSPKDWSSVLKRVGNWIWGGLNGGVGGVSLLGYRIKVP